MNTAQVEKYKDMAFDRYNEEKSEQLIRWTLETYDTLKVIEHALRGEDWSESQGMWVKKTKPLMNDEGIAKMMQILKIIDNKDNLLGNLESKQINEICLDICEDVVSQIRTKHAQYAIDPKDWTLIVNMISQKVEIFLSRPMDGKERERLTPQLKSHEIVTHREQPQPQSWKPKLFGGGSDKVGGD